MGCSNLEQFWTKYNRSGTAISNSTGTEEFVRDIFRSGEVNLVELKSLYPSNVTFARTRPCIHRVLPSEMLK